MSRRAHTVIFGLLFFASSVWACTSDYAIWIPRSPDADPLYRFVKGEKAGYIDHTGHVVVPPVIDDLAGNYGGEFHDGLAEIGVGDGEYVDRTGKKVIAGLNRGWDFSEGLAVAMPKNLEKWGYINTKGEFAISPRFDTSPGGYVWPFQGGFAKIEVEERIGYINHSGEFTIAPKFLEGDSFHDGMARVIVEGPCVYASIPEESPCPKVGVLPKNAEYDSTLPSCRYTFIDQTGQIISHQRFDQARHFAEGLASVQIGKAWGYIDKRGAPVIPPKFDSAAPFSDGLARVSEKGLYGYIDHTGHYAIAPRFTSASDFAEGRAVVGDQESGDWYIDHSGRQAIAERFAVASPFFKGLAHVKLRLREHKDESIYEGTFAYIDRNGKRVFTYRR
jgi:hypothetical protein